MQDSGDPRGLDEFKSDLGGKSEKDLRELRDDLNKRKDYDYSQHGGQPGPDSPWLWERVQAVEAELEYKSGGVWASIYRWTRKVFDPLAKDILRKLVIAFLVGLLGGRLGGVPGFIICFILAFIIVELIWRLWSKVSANPRETSWVPFGAASALAVLVVAAFSVGNADDGSDRDIATVKPTAPAVGRASAPPVEPCQVATHVPFWESRVTFEFSPASLAGGEALTVVVVTDAEGVAVIESDSAGFHARVGGEEFGPGTLTNDRLVFTGRLSAGAVGSVAVELAHGDFVFAETSGGCLTRTGPGGS